MVRIQIIRKQKDYHVTHIQHLGTQAPCKVESEHGDRRLSDRTFALKRNAQKLKLKALT
jgi:hypothetical protein